MIFWLIVALMTVAALALVLVPLVRSHRRAPRRAEYDLAIYRDQLQELESDRARGLVGEDQSEAARLEIQRRMLAASKKDSDPDQPAAAGGGARPWLLMAAIGTAIPALALALYVVWGSPGMPGVPFSGVAQDGSGMAGENMAGQSVEAAIANLAKRLEQNPNNLEDWVLLGRSLIAIERYSEAVQALRTAAKLSRDNVDILSSMAEAMVFAAEGMVTPEAQAAFESVLKLRGDDAAAQYYLGMALAQKGRPGEALGVWRKLAAETPPNAPWRQDLVTLMRRAAEESGIELGEIPSAPALRAEDAAPGPSQEDMAAAADMTPEERQEMIRSMVARLAEARDAYARAAELAPGDTAVLGDYARAVMNAAGDATEFPAQAIALYRQIIGLDPEQREALWFLGYAEAAAGNNAAARDYWNRLLDLLPADGPNREAVEQALDALRN